MTLNHAWTVIGMPEKWYEKSLRRHLFDMHIADWDDQFLADLDPDKLAADLVREKCTAVTVFANTHTGLCNYPTKAGQIHRGLKHRDALGEMIDAARRVGLDVIVYYCLIYIDWYWDMHPEARFVDADGKSDKVRLQGKAGAPGRLSTLCLNHQGYREFVAAQLSEICTGYDFDGVWLDMTFWPGACYCRTCRERYLTETGLEIPRRVDWTDPDWMRFHRRRQAWLAEYAALVSGTVKRLKPGVSVVHQSGAFAGDWTSGVSLALARHTDWLSADLYFSRDEQAIYAKLFYSLSRIKPFEHIHCWYYPNVFEHVVAQSPEHLRCTAFAALMNHGATVFIDALDPVGTVNEANYQTAGRIYAEIASYEPFIGGRFRHDIGIYLNYDAFVDFSANREATTVEVSKHKKAFVAAGRAMLANHLPFGVVTANGLSRLADYQLVMLPNVSVLSSEEMEALRVYVRDGGSLYASKFTSLLTPDGRLQNDFMLADLFGVSYEGETGEIVTYVAPDGEYAELFAPFTAAYPATLQDSQAKVKAAAGARVLATLTLPWTDPRGAAYASMLADPPGFATASPSLVLNQYGKGRVLYSAGAVEIWEHDSLRSVLGRLLRLLLKNPPCFETDAPRPVEITMFDQAEERRYIVNLLNHQQELPNIPIEGIKVRLRMDGKRGKDLRLLPGGAQLPFVQEADTVEFIVPRLETFAMLSMRYG